MCNVHFVYIKKTSWWYGHFLGTYIDWKTIFYFGILPSKTVEKIGSQIIFSSKNFSVDFLWERKRFCLSFTTSCRKKLNAFIIWEPWVHFHSSQFQSLCSTKSSSETLQKIFRVKNKVAQSEKRKKQLWVFVHIESFRWNVSLSTN